MNSIDDDAKLIGIDEDTWHKFREHTARIEQAEFEQIAGPVDDNEAIIRHKQAMTARWFGYYKKCKDPQKKMSLIDSYNLIAHQRQRQ